MASATPGDAMAVRALALACLAFSTPVLAFPGDQAVFAGVSYDRIFRSGNPPGHGMGSLVGWQYALADDWNLWTAATYAAHIGPRPSSDLGGLSVGASYVIDQVSWVPEFFGAVGFFSGVGHRVWGPDFGVAVGFGMEYRPYREFGAGFRGQYRLLARQFGESPGMLALSVQVAYHF